MGKLFYIKCQKHWPLQPVWLEITNLNHLIAQSWKQPRCRCWESSTRGSHNTQVQLRNLKNATNICWELPDLKHHDRMWGCNEGKNKYELSFPNLQFSLGGMISTFYNTWLEVLCFLYEHSATEGQERNQPYRFLRKCVLLLEQQKVVIVPTHQGLQSFQHVPCKFSLLCNSS